MSSQTWTDKRPTAGKWWVAIHPSKRHERLSGGVLAVDAAWPSGWIDADLTGAKWLPRETPADPPDFPT